MKCLFIIIMFLITQLALACPACPTGASYSGTGATTSVSGCRCTTTTSTWNGSSCVEPAVSCSTSTLNWGAGCSASFTSTTSGGTRNATNTVSSYTGSATFACNNGAWSYQSGTCSAVAANCTTVTRSWGAGCSGSVAGTTSGTNSTASNTAAGYSGSATFSCSNGGWTLLSGSTCTANVVACPSTTKTWGSCSASLASTTASSLTVSNTNSGYTGSATYACNTSTGTWATSPSSQSCAAYVYNTATDDMCNAPQGAACSPAANGGVDGCGCFPDDPGTVRTFTWSCSGGVLNKTSAQRPACP